VVAAQVEGLVKEEGEKEYGVRNHGEMEGRLYCYYYYFYYYHYYYFFYFYYYYYYYDHHHHHHHSPPVP